MKLGVVTTSYPRFEGDPAGSFVGEHVEAMRALGHHVDVIAAGGGPRDHELATRRNERLRDELEARRASGVIARLRGDLGLFSRGGAPDALEAGGVRALVGAASLSLRMLAEVHRRARAWDAIVAHWLVPSAVIAATTDRPVLAIAHGGDIHTLRRLRLLAPVLHLLHARRVELVFVSEALRTVARAAAPELSTYLDRARVQPMGIDVTRFRAIPRRPTTPPTILVVARLVPIKGVDVAIDAMAHVRTRSRLVIAGDGPLREQLVDRAMDVARSALGLEVHDHAPPLDMPSMPGARVEVQIDPSMTWLPNGSPERRIDFVGHVPTDERDRLVAEASLVLVPSRALPNGRTEGMPMIALEAIASGVPLVATETGGLAELRSIAPATRFVAPDDAISLARAIDDALTTNTHTGASNLDQLAWDRVVRALIPTNA